MKYILQLLEQQTIKIILKNIHGPTTFLLKGFTIQTSKKQIKKASILLEEARLVMLDK